MEDVLIIGGTGFLGSWVVRRLARENYRVHATHTPGRHPPLPAGVSWIPCDLTKQGFPAAFPEACRSVLFLAQSRNYRAFPAGAKDMLDVNVNGLLQTAAYAQRIGARNLIIASTGSVYTHNDAPAREISVIDTQANRSFYVASKLAGEILTAVYRSLLAVIHLRIFFPYGAGQNEDMLFPQLIARVREEKPIKLHAPDGLIANPIYAADVAEAFRRCIDLDASGVYNVGGPDCLTLRQVGMIIGDVVGREPLFDENPGTTAPMFVGETCALKQALGWAPSISLRDGLREWVHSAQKEAA